MSFSSDSQRKAIFASMQGNPHFVARAHTAVRRWGKKHPLLSETAIGIPAFAFGVAIGSKLRVVRPFAGALAKAGMRIGAKGYRSGKIFTRIGGYLTKGAIHLATDLPAFAVADSTIRKSIYGKRYKQPQASLGTSLAGGIAGERVARYALRGVRAL